MNNKKSFEENATNTKCCNNCNEQDEWCDHKLLKVNKLACSRWLRNPSLWLSILPTEPGDYFWRLTEGHPYRIIKVTLLAETLAVQDISGLRMQLDNFIGQWQGPFEPQGTR